MILDELAPAAVSDDSRFLSHPLEHARGECEVTELGLEVQIVQTLEQRGIYDASRLKARKPEVYAIIRKLLSTGLIGKDEIARLCGVAWETVAAVEVDGAGSIRDLKTRLCAHLSLALTAAAEGLIRRAKAGALTALDFGILVDKLLLLSGEATQRIELVEDPVVADFRRFIEAHPVGPPMGFVAGNPGKGGAAAAGGLALEAGGLLLEALPVGQAPAGILEPARLDLAQADQANSRAGDLQALVDGGANGDGSRVEGA